MTLVPTFSGSVEVITGSMFSGKTEELIRRVKRAVLSRQRVQAFKPRIDDRYDANRIVSHPGFPADGADVVVGGSAGLSLAATAVATSDSLEARVLNETQVVAIDEAQFFDRGIVDVVGRLADRGVRVIVAGLDQDYLGRPFYPMPELMSIAEHVTKVHAVCMVCGATASRSQRLIHENGTVLVGGSESYEARCRACFVAREIVKSPDQVAPADDAVSEDGSVDEDQLSSP
ncbi:MAG: thymidine kinase [Polyangiaceae bacterium]